jgi:pimeloyl-ACP methyl ester carboxylesterase
MNRGFAMSSPQTQFVTSRDGTRIALDVYGEDPGKPVLIYITGAICFRKFMPVVGDAKIFAQRFMVYNYDRRGRGDSGNASTWSVDREVDDIEALIDAAGGSAVLYGHSSGAVLALEAALRLGSKVTRAIVYDVPYVHDEAEKVSFTALGLRVDGLLAAGQNAAALKAFVTGIGMPKVMALLLPLFPGWKSMKALAPTLAYDIALTRDLPPVDRFARIAVPVKVMAGAKNPAGIVQVAETLARAIPGATLTVMQGQDHMVSAKVLLPELL